jgi:uncharacterized protein (TIGR00369 family)
MSTEPVRERRVRWTDPSDAFRRGAELGGLEYLRAMAAGELPAAPISALMSIEPLAVDEGRVSFVATPGEQHLNPVGVVHGGLVLALLDSAMGCAVHTTPPAGTGYTTVEVKTNFVRPVRPDAKRIVATGRVVHRGGRVATADGRVVREGDGKLVAHGTTTCLILPSER